MKPDSTSKLLILSLSISLLLSSFSLNAQKISAGAFQSISLCADSTVKAWGSNNHGQVGDGTIIDRHAPVSVPGLAHMVSVSAGNNFCLALSAAGAVRSWGYNYNGNLGNGGTTDAHSPVTVSGLTAIVAIAGGDNHGLALRLDSTVWAWGDDGYGQLGDNSYGDVSCYCRKTPVQVSGLTGVIAIAAGEDHSLALKADGTVWAWGANAKGQLGDTTNTERLTPVKVYGLTNVIAIASGHTAFARFSLALKADSTVWSWGDNSYGQLGDGTTTERDSAVQVSGLTGVVAIAAGTFHGLALKADSTVRAWGDNSAGELGDGTTTERHTPVTVSGLTNAVRIAGGYYNSFAVKANGAAWACGTNGFGQLGDNTTTERHACVAITSLCALFTEVENIIGEKEISLYPNPSNGNFSISFKEPIANAVVKIFNMMGAQVYAGQLSNASINKMDIELKSSAGIYFVQLSNNEKQVVQKIIIQ